MTRNNSKGTRYDEGDMVQINGTGTRYEVLHIIEPESDSPDYVIQNSQGDRQTVKASQIKKADQESGWKQEAMRDLMDKEDVTLENHDGTSRGGNRRGVFVATTPDGRKEYEVFKNRDIAHSVAKQRIKEDIEMQPEIFNQSFLKNHVYVTDTDARMIAQDDARSRTEGRTRAELEGMADRYNAEVSKDMERSELREKVEIAMSEKFKKQIKEDPIDYFSDIYGEDKVMEQSFIRINSEEAAEAAIQADGIAHFISFYDGQEILLPSGALAYRVN